MKNEVVQKKRNSKGLSLIEASMVLALSAIVISGVMVHYHSASENKKTQDTMTLVMGAMNTINMAFANEKDFSKLLSRGDANDILLINSTNIPEKFKKRQDNMVLNPFGGELKVLGTLDWSKHKNDRFTIELYNVPKSACSVLGMINLGNNHYSTSINEVNADLDYGVLTKDLTPTKVSSMCKNKDKNAIYYLLTK